MAARASMANLILRLRRMIDDVGAAAFTDDELQIILDSHRESFYGDRLQSPSGGNGRVYFSGHDNLEEFNAGDDSVFRLFDTVGAAVTGFTADYVAGQFVFASNQNGAVYFLDGRDYDLNGAAADCWRQAAGSKAKFYTFADAGLNKYDRSDWFKHCLEMVKEFKQMARTRGARTIRA